MINQEVKMGANRKETRAVPNRCKLKRKTKMINDITVTRSAKRDKNRHMRVTQIVKTRTKLKARVLDAYYCSSWMKQL